MRKIFVIVFFILGVGHSYAQSDPISYYDKDLLSIELHSAQWLDIPSEIKLSPRSLAFNIQLMYTLLGKNSHVALASGVGLLAEHYHINAYPIGDDTLKFEPLDNGIKYKENKIRFLTVELPLEVRIRSERNSRNKLWKFYFGGKVGYMFQTMHKYDGDNPNQPNKSLDIKKYDLPYTEPFTYGVTGRIGYDQVMISAYYGLTNHFQINKGPKIQPFMIGLTLFFY